MNSDKLIRRKDIFHLTHRLVGNDDVLAGMNFKIVFHAFNINNI